MKLINPTDHELKKAFGVHVCKWHAVMGGRFWANAAGDIEAAIDEFDWTTSADAVLPWLEKCYQWSNCYDNTAGGVKHEIGVLLSFAGKGAKHADDSFPRAAVIALLRAHGVQVEFQPSAQAAKEGENPTPIP